MSKKEGIASNNLLLFVDTETKGVPNDDTRSYRDVDNWPSIRQISWLVYNKSGDKISESNYYTERPSLNSANLGNVENVVRPIYEILPEFVSVISHCAMIIGHNIQYDVNVIMCELHRLGLDVTGLEGLPQFCTMHEGVIACLFDTVHGSRYPKLQELYTKLFHRPFRNAHNSYYDIVATADCFWELFNQGYLDVYNYPLLLDESMKLEQINIYIREADSIFDKWERKGCKDDDSPLLALPHYDKALEYCYDKESKNIVAKALFRANYRMRTGSCKYFRPFLEKSAKLDYGPALVRLAYDTDDDEKRVALFERALSINYYNAAESLYAHYYSKAEREKNSGNPLYGFYYSLADQYLNKWEEYCKSNFDSLDRNLAADYIKMFAYGEKGKTIDLDKAKALCLRALSNGLDINGLLEIVLEARGELSERFNLLLIDLIEYENKLIEQGLIEEMKNETWQKYCQCNSERNNYLFYLLEVFRCYFDGYGTRKDYTKAKELLDKGTSIFPLIFCGGYNHYNHNQLRDLTYYLGLYYENGYANVPIDYAKARDCYEISNACNNPQASVRLGELLLYGKGGNPDYDKALKLFQEAEKYDGIDVQAQIHFARKAIKKRRWRI